MLQLFLCQTDKRLSVLQLIRLTLSSAVLMLLLTSHAAAETGLPTLELSSKRIDFGSVEVGDWSSRQLTLTNNAKSQSLHIETLFLDERDDSNFATDIAGDIQLQAGESRSINIYFNPAVAGDLSGMMFITHNGSTNVDVLHMSGFGIVASDDSTVTEPLVASAEGFISFGKSQLNGMGDVQPTSLQFGPDGRLYVASMNGQIFVYTVQRDAANQYAIISSETINLIKDIPNHDDDGALNTSVVSRLVTGIAVEGTASAPVIYVTSSDPRIGGGGSGLSTNLDTNSGILSRLDKAGSGWQKTDLVRGLPRSEENHHNNGIAVNISTNKLYIAMGGNTNQGAPSNNFALLPEYALSAAILEVDLGAIANSTYDLPTLDDEDRAGINDANDPFGGNRGKNQSMLVSGGPVQVYAPGFRNPYDVLITQAGNLYTWDNGPNGGWGGVPGGACDNSVVEPGQTRYDSLHLINGYGYYGGHPNPVRGNASNTFNETNPQSPVPFANSVECEYYGGTGSGFEQHPQNLALMSTPASTNGLAEYTASNFGGAMKGNLLAAAFNNKLYRVSLNAAGNSVESSEALFSNVGGTPLDVTVNGDSDPFPGTIWVADFSSKNVVVFEPGDYGTTGSPNTDATDNTIDNGTDNNTDNSTDNNSGSIDNSAVNDNTQDSGITDSNNTPVVSNGCSANNPAIDSDGDGFTNADEQANSTNPCSAADFPADWDADGVSDLIDNDDDNDGLTDNIDPFALDSANGATTNLPVSYQWENNSPQAGFLANLGFSGLMTNGVDNYQGLFDLDDMTVRGAAGVVTVDNVPAGDAAGASNTQAYAFQFGLNVKPGSAAFRVKTRVAGPFAGVPVGGYQSMGLFIGDGTQDNYLKLVANSLGNAGGVELAREVFGALDTSYAADAPVIAASYVDLILEVAPADSTATGYYQVTANGVTGSIQQVGGTVSFPSDWMTGSSKMAVGIISTSNSGPTFPGTWDFIEAAPVDVGSLNTGINESSDVSPVVVVQGDESTQNDTQPIADTDAQLVNSESGKVALGGSGCTLRGGATVDPVLLVLLLIAGLALTRRTFVCVAGGRQAAATVSKAS